MWKKSFLLFDQVKSCCKNFSAHKIFYETETIVSLFKSGVKKPVNPPYSHTPFLAKRR